MKKVLSFVLMAACLVGSAALAAQKLECKNCKIYADGSMLCESCTITSG